MIALTVIAALGAFTRFVELDSAPPGLYIDEASFGYNAYSILKTGRDEYGVRLPLFTRSFGTGKNPVYLYSTVASVAVFGLNEKAVRRPAAVFGVLTIIVTYSLGVALIGSSAAGLLAALFLALCPWHIFFSRFAVEVSSMTFFLALGMLLLLKGFKKPSLFPLAGIILGVSFFTYAPTIPFVPMMVAAFAFCFRNELAGRWKIFAFSMAIAALFLALRMAPTGESQYQMDHFRSQTIFSARNDAASRDILKKSTWPAPLFSESRGVVLKSAVFIRNYISNYSPAFLFKSGDRSTWRASVKGYGQFLRVTAPFLIAGLLLMIFSLTPERRFVLLWFLLYPIGASITSALYPQATRSMNAVPCYELIFAAGAIWLYSTTKKILISKTKVPVNIIRTFLTVAFLIILAIDFSGFAREYFTAYPKYSSYDWNAGFRETISFSENKYPANQEITVSSGIPFSYIYPLFYTGYDPNLYQNRSTERTEPAPIRVGRYVIRDPYLQRASGKQIFIVGFWERPDLECISPPMKNGIKSVLKICETRSSE